MMPELYEPEQLHQVCTALGAYKDCYHDNNEISAIDMEELAYVIYVASRDNFKYHMPQQEIPNALDKPSFFQEVGMEMPVYMPIPKLYRSLEYARMLMKHSEPPSQVLKDINTVLLHMRRMYKRQHKVEIYFSVDYCEAKDSLMQDDNVSVPDPAMRVLIANPDYRAIYGAWVALPSTYMTIDQVYSCTDLMPGECIINTENISFYDQFSFLEWKEGGSASLDLLNFIAARLSKLSTIEVNKLHALYEWGLCSDPYDTAIILEYMDDFYFNNEITSPYSLGQHLVTALIEEYENAANVPGEILEFMHEASQSLDMEKYGRQHLDAGNGLITNYGYVGTVKNDTLRDIMSRVVKVPKQYEITPTPQRIKERNGECR